MTACRCNALRDVGRLRTALTLTGWIGRTGRCLQAKESAISIEGKVKEAAGYAKEEMNEHGKLPEAQKKA